jgi:DegV family protein with EDD domain
MRQNIIPCQKRLHLSRKNHHIQAVYQICKTVGYTPADIHVLNWTDSPKTLQFQPPQRKDGKRVVVCTTFIDIYGLLFPSDLTNQEDFMSKIALVTDSTAYIPKEFLEQYGITVTPQVLIWGDQTYKDGVDIQPDEFYARLKTAKVMPSTSQVSVVDMHKTFFNLLEQGYEVLGIFLSSKLSGTIQSAVQGREELAKGKDKVEIIDSNTTAMAMGFQVLSVARAAAEGASMNECKSLAEKARAYTGVYFVVDTLEFLHRGGRIGGAQRLLGTALNLKPILALQDGRVEALERIRTKGKAVERLINIVAEQTAGKKPVRLASLHANAPDEARALLEQATKLINPDEVILTDVSPVVGTHTGPGTLALAYMAGM